MPTPAEGWTDTQVGSHNQDSSSVYGYSSGNALQMCGRSLYCLYCLCLLGVPHAFLMGRVVVWLFPRRGRNFSDTQSLHCLCYEQCLVAVVRLDAMCSHCSCDHSTEVFVGNRHHRTDQDRCRKKRTKTMCGSENVTVELRRIDDCCYYTSMDPAQGNR